MSYSIEEFGRDCRDALVMNFGPSTGKEIEGYLIKLLADPEAFDRRLARPGSGTYTFCEDEETGLRAYDYLLTEPQGDEPHDHGPCFVVYANITGHTDMGLWRRTDGGTRDGHAELELEREFRLGPGDAYAFLPGMIHSAKFSQGSHIIRVTTDEVNSATTLAFDVEHKKATIRPRPKGRWARKKT